MPKEWVVIDGRRFLEEDVRGYLENGHSERLEQIRTKKQAEDAAAQQELWGKEAYPGELEDIARSEAQRAGLSQTDNSKSEK